MSRPSRRLLEAMGMSLLTNILRVVLPTVASVCTPRDEAFVNAIARQKSEDYSRFNCAEGEYNALGSIVWVPLEVSISVRQNHEHIKERKGLKSVGMIQGFHCRHTHEHTYHLGAPKSPYLHHQCDDGHH